MGSDADGANGGLQVLNKSDIVMELCIWLGECLDCLELSSGILVAHVYVCVLRIGPELQQELLMPSRNQVV